MTYLEDADLDGAVDDADANSGDPGHLQSNIHREVGQSARSDPRGRGRIGGGVGRSASVAYEV